MTGNVPPFFWPLLACFIVAVLALVILLYPSDHEIAPRRTRRSYHPVRRTFGTLLLLVAVLAGLLALSVYRYLELFTDRPVAVVEIVQDDKQQYTLQLGVFDNHQAIQRLQQYLMRGDAWMIEARVMRWRLPAALAGVPSLYRLERLAGRYDDIDQERTQPRTVYGLDDWALPDLFTLKQSFPRWLPFVEIQHGNATWMPMFNGARYTVLFNDRGGLLARPSDTYTADRLKSMGW